MTYFFLFHVTFKCHSFSHSDFSWPLRLLIAGCHVISARNLCTPRQLPWSGRVTTRVQTHLDIKASTYCTSRQLFWYSLAQTRCVFRLPVCSSADKRPSKPRRSVKLCCTAISSSMPLGYIRPDENTPRSPRILCRISATLFSTVWILSTHFPSLQHSLPPIFFCILGSPFAAAGSLHCAADCLLVRQQTHAEVSYCCFFRTLNDIPGTRVIGVIDRRIRIEVFSPFQLHQLAALFFFLEKSRRSFVLSNQQRKKKHNPVSSVSCFISRLDRCLCFQQEWTQTQLVVATVSGQTF